MKKRASKWLKYKFMIKSNRVASHLPKTVLFTKSAFWHMLNKYGQIIVKPVLGSRGARVKMITALNNKTYEFHLENKKTIFTSKESLYAYVLDQVKDSKREHLVQQRINLAMIDDRPFDMRVVVQRKTPDSSWQVTGMLAKVAGQGYIVTNITRSKGKVMHIRSAIRRSSLNAKSASDLENEINHVALLSANRLGKLYPDHRIFGFDMGFDKKGHIWIIEANLKPQMSHFHKLGDEQMYRNIMSFKKYQEPISTL